MTQIGFAGVGVDFGATTLFSDVTFTVAPGERWGIVGRNGSGKTTLFRLLTGDLERTRGSIARAPIVPEYGAIQPTSRLNSVLPAGSLESRRHDARRRSPGADREEGTRSNVIAS